MSRAVAAPDPYRRRRQAGAASREETRRRLLAAADELFRAKGYPATTVDAIASRAGVSLQTLYLAWGSKRALLMAAGDAAAVASDTPMGHEEWRATIRQRLAAHEGATASSYLTAAARLFVQVAERTAPYWRMNQQAAVADPEIAASWQTNMAERRRTMEAVAEVVPRAGLRPEVTPEETADTLWSLASPEVYELWTGQAGRVPAAYRAWLERTLVAALCAQ